MARPAASIATVLDSVVGGSSMGIRVPELDSKIPIQKYEDREDRRSSWHVEQCGILFQMSVPIL